MSAFRVTWPTQVASGRPCEEYATESRAELRARELVATGASKVVIFEVSDEGENAA